MMTPNDLYDKGSEQCRQYSMQTMQVRTLAQHVLIGYAVGLGAVLSRLGNRNAGPTSVAVIAFGAILIVFGLVLWILNHHYSHAFRAIRDDVLVQLEKHVEKNPLAGGNGPNGPWTAHKNERNTRMLGPFNAAKVAWNAPFIALIVAGVAGILCALWTFDVGHP